MFGNFQNTFGNKGILWGQRQKDHEIAQAGAMKVGAMSQIADLLRKTAKRFAS